MNELLSGLLSLLTVATPIFGTAPSVLKVQQGGTGVASFSIGECLKGNGTGPITSGACGEGTADGTFSTTSAAWWVDQYSKGYFFSTTSADYWETQQAARGGSGFPKWATSTADTGSIYPAGAQRVGVGSSTPWTALSVVGTTTLHGVIQGIDNPFVIWDSFITNDHLQDIFSHYGNGTNFCGMGFVPYVDAFRGGCDNTNTKWTGAKLAYGSFAFGDDVEASGDTSTAFGRDTTATNDSSFVFGSNTLSSGPYALAGGDSSSVASGVSAVAIGTGVLASGDGAVAFGSFTKATSTDSFSTGLRNVAGPTSTSIVSGNYTASVGGSDNVAAKDYAATLGGFTSTAAGQFAVVIGGQQNYASGEGALVGGGGNRAAGDYSAILGGQSNTVLGNRSVILGGTNLTVTAPDIVAMINASTTRITASAYASTSKFFADGLITCNSGNMLTWSAGVFGCAADTVGAGGSWPFTIGTYNSQVTSASTTLLHLTGAPLSLAASTSHLTYASSTAMTALTAWISDLYIGAVQIAEYIADTAGAMFSGNTETGVTVTYQDADNTIDVVCDTASGSVFGCLTSADWTTFNNKENALTFSLPLIRTANTISWSGLSTTTQPSSSNLLVSNGGAGVYGVATSTLSASSPLTGSFVQIGSGGSLGIQNASASQGGAITAGDYTRLYAATTTFTYPLIYTQATNAVTFPATSTLYGSGTGGQVLVWNNTLGRPIFAATSTCIEITGSAALCDGDDATGGAGSTEYIELTNVYSTSTAGTSTVVFTGNVNAPPSWSGGVLTIQKNIAYYTVEVWGGGGGGAAQATNAGVAGVQSCFSQGAIACNYNGSNFMAQANGGVGGTAAGAGGAGGAATRGILNRTGGKGTGLNAGGNAFRGGLGGGSQNSGAAGSVGDAPGGGGGAGRTTTSFSAGGGAGGYSFNVATSSPKSNAVFSIGNGGAGGTAGTQAGGRGGDGGVIITIYATSTSII